MKSLSWRESESHVSHKVFRSAVCVFVLFSTDPCLIIPFFSCFGLHLPSFSSFFSLFPFFPLSLVGKVRLRFLSSRRGRTVLVVYLRVDGDAILNLILLSSPFLVLSPWKTQQLSVYAEMAEREKTRVQRDLLIDVEWVVGATWQTNGAQGNASLLLLALFPLSLQSLISFSSKILSLPTMSWGLNARTKTVQRARKKKATEKGNLNFSNREISLLQCSSSCPPPSPHLQHINS